MKLGKFLTQPLDSETPTEVGLTMLKRALDYTLKYNSAFKMDFHFFHKVI